MNEILFLALLSLALGVFYWSFRRYDRLLQFPFLMTCDLLFFLCPQLYYIAMHPDTYANRAPAAFTLFLGICTLFYVGALAGYHSGTVRFRLPDWRFNPNRMIAGLFVLGAISLYGNIKLASLPAEMTNASQWSGLPVRYLFFASVGNLCLPLGIILYYLYRRKIILVPLLFELGNILAMVVFKGRRSPAAFLGLMLLTGLWFARRFKIPVGMIVAGGIVFFMFVTNIEVYRSMVKGAEKVDWHNVVAEVFDFDKAVARFSGKGSGKETAYYDALNGIVSSAAVFSSGRYDYGIMGWNNIVRTWVPSQLLGQGIKKALQFDAASPLDVARDEFGYESGRGSCVPGYSEIFASFGFFGVVFMYAMGRMARMVWEQALAGNLIAQVAHFALAPIYLRFGGGGIWPLLSGLIFWVVFLLPVLLYARLPRRFPCGMPPQGCEGWS